MHLVKAKHILTASHTGMNVYRGCTHGCIYCDSRSLVYGMEHDFEDVAVKANAPELLDRELRSKRKRCMVGTGSMSDPYQPCERELLLMRRCLEIVAREGFGATLLTKSDLVLRDLDLLEKIVARSKAVVQMTLTCADDTLSKIIEPHVVPTSRRFEVLCELRDAGIPTVVWLCPVLPHLTDSRDNVEALLDMCVEARVRGVVCFGMGMTLRDGNREHYYAALDRHFPGLADRYRAEYGDAYSVESPNAAELTALLDERLERAGILKTPDECFGYLQEYPARYDQLTLF